LGTIASVKPDSGTPLLMIFAEYRSSRSQESGAASAVVEPSSAARQR
jgi:hypothetical protein